MSTPNNRLLADAELLNLGVQLRAALDAVSTEAERQDSVKQELRATMDRLNGRVTELAMLATRAGAALLATRDSEICAALNGDLRGAHISETEDTA